MRFSGELVAMTIVHTMLFVEVASSVAGSTESKLCAISSSASKQHCFVLCRLQRRGIVPAAAVTWRADTHLRCCWLLQCNCMLHSASRAWRALLLHMYIWSCRSKLWTWQGRFVDCMCRERVRIWSVCFRNTTASLLLFFWCYSLERCATACVATHAAATVCAGWQRTLGHMQLAFTCVLNGGVHFASGSAICWMIVLVA